MRSKPRRHLLDAEGSEEFFTTALAPLSYNNPEAWDMNLMLFELFPRYEIRPAALMEFGKPDYDIFSLERWPLRSVTQPTKT